MKNVKKQVEITANSCRLCLKQCTYADEDSGNLAERYYTCTGFKITDEDVPKKICRACKSHLNKFWYFRNKCNRTEKTLVDNVAGSTKLVYTFIKEEEHEEALESLSPVKSFEDVKKEPIFAEPLHEVFSNVEAQSPKQPAIICDMCGASYRDKYLFRDHRLEHLVGPEDPKFVCDICVNRYPNRPPEKFSFLIKKKLLMHMQRIHLRQKRTFPCQHCGKALTDKQALKFHIYQHHVDPREYKYECQICSQRFYKKSAFQDHQHVHTGDKRHICHICGQKFTTSGHRSQHMTSLHNLSIQSCNICGKTFNNLRYLKQHMQSHNQDYKCPICPEKTFSLTTTLRSHIKTNHPDIHLPAPGTKLKNYDWSKVLGGSK